MIRRLLSAVVATLPAMLFATVVFMTFEQDAYYTRPWQIASMVFLVASFLLGLKFVARSASELDSISAVRFRLIAGPFLAWVLAVAILFGLSFTPLVLGQDNGDGSNGYAECLFFAVLSSFLYSGFVMLTIIVNSLLPARFLRGVHRTK